MPSINYVANFKPFGELTPTKNMDTQEMVAIFCMQFLIMHGRECSVGNLGSSRCNIQTTWVENN